MKILLLLLLLPFTSIIAFSQQRIGVEVSSRLEDLTLGINFQKVVDNNFLVGGGLLIQGRYIGFSDINNGNLHVQNPFPFVQDTLIENGNTYTLKDYSSRSGVAFCSQLILGYFHEFSNFHGIRINMNVRLGIAHVEVNGKYHNFADRNYNYKTVKGWIPYSAVSPEVYHTLRQSNKWTFYYGIRFPLYFTIPGYNPHYSTDIYHKDKVEFALGITRFVGKEKKEE